MLLVGRQEGHPACKKTVVMCWHGYLSGTHVCSFNIIVDSEARLVIVNVM